MAVQRRGCGLPVSVILTTAYLAFALYAWIDFTHTNHDGLANVGLFLVTLPVTLVDLMVGAMLGRSGILMPSGYGYIGDHALYYGPAVAVTALLLFLIGRRIDRWMA